MNKTTWDIKTTKTEMQHVEAPLYNILISTLPKKQISNNYKIDRVQASAKKSQQTRIEIH